MRVCTRTFGYKFDCFLSDFYDLKYYEFCFYKYITYYIYIWLWVIYYVNCLFRNHPVSINRKKKKLQILDRQIECLDCRFFICSFFITNFLLLYFYQFFDCFFFILAFSTGKKMVKMCIDRMLFDQNFF